MAEYLLRALDIKKYFAGVKALDGVSLEIRPGEIHCLAGENGCGKSTLIKIISGVYQRDSGTIEFEGKTAPLSKNESRILGVLLRHKGEIVSRETLMNALWETDCFVDENTLTVNVTRLRRRLESVGAPDMIQTRKGVGYLIS